MSTGDETRDRDATDPIRRIDELCDRFEDEWRAGRGRAAADYLHELGLDRATAPPELVREVARLEAEYRGQTAGPAERFAPGTVLAGRYRVEGLLGKGGMGEVYKAFDQRLGQPVALKFLPAKLALEPAPAAQFKTEVLVARQVTHPNVCRVHDYDEHAGQPFLSMEYIDGEDLASLLRRIRRLPEDTAVELARQLCLGLAAAHAQGLLHRDLKPGNVMIDGRGRPRITDFGLAGRAGSFTGDAVRAGTPAYMAPEQLAGTEVDVRSDVYALGLVLYETFTGKRAFPAATTGELARLQRDGTPSAPSSHVPALSPIVERVILRCLAHDPDARPQSASEVLRGLPGGELAAALDAGQTPSPQVVAGAGGTGGLRPGVGLTLLAGVLVATLLAAWLNDHAALFRRVPARSAPVVLAHQAQTHLKALGYNDPPADSAYALATDEPLLEHLRENHPETLAGHPSKPVSAPVMVFWYRQRPGPKPLAQRLAANDTSGWSMPGRVLPDEPPLREPGEACVSLDLAGRLLELLAVPPRESPPEPAGEPDPMPLLKAAGLADAELRPVEPQRVPPVYADRVMAWEGTDPAMPGVPVRVEAGFVRGRPVFFHTAPAGLPDRVRLGPMPENLGELIHEWENMILGLVALPVGGWFAWRNWRARRANPRGATVVAGVFAGLGLVGWLLAAHHVSVPADELSMFTGVLGRVLFDGLLLWLAYLALEPWVRRTSPERVIGWNRLLAGRWADPLVGREVLLGVVAGAGVVAATVALRALPTWLGLPPDPRGVWDATFTEGAGGLTLTVHIAVMVAFRKFFLFVLLRLVCRREWRATALMLPLLAVSFALAHGGVYWGVMAAVGGVYAAAGLLTVRAGLVAFLAFTLTEEVLNYLPVTTDTTTWYAWVSGLSLLLVVGLAGYGTWAACRRLPAAATG
jgi:predicted Ser/Thr protein kinase